jgi:DNA polymerase-3 subunit alpha
MKFVGLHSHTGFSIGDGLSFPKDHFEFVIKNSESNCLAITDHGNMNALGYAIQGQNELRKKGINFKAISGIEAYIHPNLEEWKRLKENKGKKSDTVGFIENEKETKGKYYNPLNRRHHLVILAKNPAGLKNLFKLVSNSYQEGFYRYPRMDFDMLEQHKEGLVISSACIGGLPSWIIFRDYEKGSEAIQKSLDIEFKPLLDIFGKENAYVEIQFNSLEEQKIANEELIIFSKRTGYKLVATADAHYPDPKLWRERELYRLLAMQSKGMTIEKDSIPKSVDELKCELYPKNGEQMFAEYKKMYQDDTRFDAIVADAIQITYDIAHDLIEDTEIDSTVKLPKSISKLNDPYEELKNLCVDKIKEKNLGSNREYLERLVKELKVIKIKNFSDYFLTLYRAVEVLNKELLLGPGRGSAAGSLIAWLLGITQIDPIKHGLLFERFLAEYREGSPDIDTDVEDRDLCLEILKKEFGEGNVVPVSNFNTLQLKSLVKDISKFYEVPFMVVNEVTMKMEQEARKSILDSIGGDQKLYVFDMEGAKKYSATFRKFLEEYPEVGNDIEALFKQIKSIGRHAGGVIICDDASSCMPMINIRKTNQTPWSEGMAAKHLEQFGLIKYDFLGLATLRFIRKAIELILIKQDKNPSFQNVLEFYNNNIHPNVLDTDDITIYNHVYRQGRFPGIFQFAEPGVQKFCRQSMPGNIEDLSAITSIWRPGPMAAGVPKLYVERKMSGEKVEFEHPVLEEILGDTYGLLCYQESFMHLAHKLAGFSLSESDQLRKLLVRPVLSMATDLKKKRDEAGEKFINGCVENGISEQRARKLWDEEILGFISYGFNKSHAISYSYLSYQCAWLLTYHEEEWVKAVLSVDKDRDKAISDVGSIGYRVVKPDINESDFEWKSKNKVIYPSLMAIKGIGEKAVEELIAIRNEEGGFFKDLEHLLYKTEIKTYKTKPSKEVKKWRFSKFNKRAFAALIQLEAFDSMNLVGPGLEYENYRQLHECLIGNYDLFKKGKEIEKPLPLQGWSNQEKIDMQKELLGTYDKSLLFSDSTLELFRKYNIRPLGEISEQEQYIWFIVKDWKPAVTKKGKPYLKIRISDMDDSPKTLNFFNKAEDLKKNSIYICKLYLNGGWINITYGNEMIKIT